MMGRVLRSSLSLVVMVLAALIVPCGPAEAVPQSVPQSLDSAMSAYRAQDFRRAATLARVAADRAQGVDRESARYLEGLSLYHAGDMDAAANALRTAASATDRFVAGQANITLGSVEIARRNFAAAGHAYRRAGGLLEGSEARRAHSFAARCFDAAELTTLAESERVAAGEPRQLPVEPAVKEAPKQVAAKPEPVAKPIEPRLPDARRVVSRDDKPKAPIAPVRYSIQAGAFEEANRAKAVAAQLRAECLRLGVGAPRIIARESSKGATLHIVQIGAFSNKSEAGRIAGKLPKSAYLIEVYLPDSAVDASDD
ncbi:MAG: hypothetical protein RLZZ116_1242 [Planctomycetota bacterium]